MEEARAGGSNYPVNELKLELWFSQFPQIRLIWKTSTRLPTLDVQFKVKRKNTKLSTSGIRECFPVCYHWCNVC